MKIGFGILLDDAPFNFIRTIELKLFEQFGIQKCLRQPPHITLIPPFETLNIEPYEAYLEELGRKMNLPEIEIKNFNSFGDKVIFLNVVDDGKLRQICEDTLSDLKRKFGLPTPTKESIFHATLGYGDLTPNVFNEAMDYLRSNFKPKFKFKPKKIGLLYQLPEDTGWIIIKEQPLN